MTKSNVENIRLFMCSHKIRLIFIVVVVTAFKMIQVIIHIWCVSCMNEFL